MALLTARSVTSASTTVSPAAVSASDTIAANDIGANGALLNVINASGGVINVTLVDPGTTALGNPGTATPQPIPDADNRWLRIAPSLVNSSGVATVTYSGTTGVTYKLIRC